MVSVEPGPAHRYTLASAPFRPMRGDSFLPSSSSKAEGSTAWLRRVPGSADDVCMATRLKDFWRTLTRDRRSRIIDGAILLFWFGLGFPGVLIAAGWWYAVLATAVVALGWLAARGDRAIEDRRARRTAASHDA